MTMRGGNRGGTMNRTVSLPIKVVVLLLMTILASSSSTHATSTTTTTRDVGDGTTDGKAKPRALQPDSSANNPDDANQPGKETPPPTVAPPPDDPCLICDEGATAFEDVLIPTMEDGTTCGDMLLYASTLESDGAECGSIRLVETVCCLQSASPTMPPSENPTEIPTENPTVTPTQNPTDNPTISPTSDPSESPSSSPTVSSMPSAAPIPYARSDRADARYVPWDELDEEYLVAATALYYNQSTWDAYGTNAIEQMHYALLSREEKAAALALGYADPESWDCWQNHYENYKWIDLGVQYIQARQWWEELGWDIYSWNKYEDPPATDGKDWYGLSDDERYAASQLCYSRRTWDSYEALSGEHPMDKPGFRFTDWYAVGDAIRDAAGDGLKYSPLSWNVLGLDVVEMRGWDDLTSFEREAATAIGFAKITWDCWQNHFQSYTWEDLTFYGLDLTLADMGWTQSSWEDLEPPPPSESTSWKDLAEWERSAASELCYFRENWDGMDMTPNAGPFPYPKVKQRYVEWDSLPSDVRLMARKSLLYNKTSWNALGTALIENRGWGELTDYQKSDGILIGFYERTWDCFQNHYRAYEWDGIERNGQDALQVLGWSITSWVEEIEPASYNNTWERLSEDEKTAATVLCFFEDSWDGTTLQPPPPSEFIGLTAEDVSEVLNDKGGSSAAMMITRRMLWYGPLASVLLHVFGCLLQVLL